MKTSFHRIHTEDGLELRGLLYKPENETKTVIAHIHGMAGNFYENKFLDFMAKTFTENGIAFCPFNNRGAEYIKDFPKKLGDEIKSVRIGSSREKFEDCVLDIKAHLDFLEGQGFTQIHLQGHSLGTPKIAYYQSRTQDKRVKSLILLSPSDMLGLVRGNRERFEEDISIAEKMIERGKGDELMSRQVWDEYPITANTYINLFGDNSEAAIFNFHNPQRGFQTLSKISCPIFTVMGRKDDVLVVPIEDIMRIIKENAKSSPRCEYQILGNATHDYKGYEKQLAETVLKWINSF